MFGRSRLALIVTAALVGAGWVLVTPPTDVVAAPSPGHSARVSLADDRTQSPSDSTNSVISADGRYSAFVSSANLSSYYTGANAGTLHSDVFVHDSQTGRTVQISVGLSATGQSDGTPSTAANTLPSISADGRYVSFVAATGASGTIVDCDRDPDGNGTFDEVIAPATYPDLRCIVVRVAHSISRAPVLSGDGARIVWGDYFQEPSVPVSQFVYVAPLLDNGVLAPPLPDQIRQLPSVVTVGGKPEYHNLSQPVISGDGNHVVYVQSVMDVTSLQSTDLGSNLELGATVQVDLAPTGGEFIGSPTDVVFGPSVSQDGQVVAFTSAPPTKQIVKFADLDLGLDRPVTAQALAPDGSPPQVYAVSLAGGGSSVLVSQRAVAGGDPLPGSGAQAALSADGRYLAFVTDRRDMHEGVAGAKPPGTCLTPVALVTADNADCQVVARDLVLDARRAILGEPYLPAQLVSRSLTANCAAGLPADAVCAAAGASSNPSLSADGKRVAFDSTANDIVADDTNQSCNGPCRNVQDAFVHTWTPPITANAIDLGDVRVGQQGDPVDYEIGVGGFGPIDFDSVVVNGTDAGDFSINSSGCAVVLHEGDTCSATLYFRPLDPAGPKTATINVYADGNATTPMLSAPVTGTATNVLPSDVGPNDIVRGSVTTGDPGGQATHGSTGESMVSSNGRYDIFVSQDNLGGIDNAGRSNIFVRDLRTNRTIQVSRGAGTSFGGIANSAAPVISNGTAPDANSTTPSISGDGRFVSFVTSASNVVNGTAAISAPYVRKVAVLCDRGAPNVQGVFTRAQRCFNLDEEPVANGYSDQQPRLGPDGRHIVFVGCNDPVYFGCNEARRVTLVRISIDPDTGLAGVFDRTGVPATVAGFNDPPSVTQYQPQVSREGLPNLGPHGVRVVFGANAGLTAIVAADIRGDAGDAPSVIRQTRLDRVPGTSKYLGDDDTAQVGDPSMSDDGTKVAWDYTDFSGGTAQSYISTVTGSGVGPVTVSAKDVSRYRNDSTLPVRAADPALSGDGRYVSYVTDSPAFDGDVPPAAIDSCLSAPGSGSFRSITLPQAAAPLPTGSVPPSGPVPPPGRARCQIVSRDLVVDAKRDATGQDPLPEALVTVSAAVPTCSSPPTAFGSTCGGNDDSIQPSMDRTGLHVGFDSYANDFVANDTNITDASGDHVSAQDAFVRTFRPRAALTPVDFGGVKVGLAVGQSATLTVVGFGPFVMDGSTVGGANPGDFSVGDGTCAAQPDHALHFDQTCTIMITFAPATPGPRAGTVSVRGQENPGVTVTVTGIGTRTVAGPAQFGGTPNPVNFGSDIPLRNPGRTKNVTVTNAGGQPLTLTSVDVIDSSVPGARGDYLVDTSDCGAVIAKGTSCVVAVTWSGRAAGPRDAVLRFVDNAPGGVQLIGLLANVPTPVVSADPGVSPGGRVTTITGSGFAPKRNVTVVLENGAEQTSTKTDAKGRFTASLVIFNNTIAGTRIMQASVDGASATLSGEAAMLIVLGTVQSPDFKLRH